MSQALPFPLPQAVADAQLDRIHPDLSGQRIHLSLEREAALRRAKSAKRAVDAVVCIYVIGIDANVGEAIGAGAALRGNFQHDVSKDRICATIEHGIDLVGLNDAVFIGAGLHPYPAGMPLHAVDKAFLPRKVHLAGPPGIQCDQPDQALDADIALAAKAAAGVGRDDHDLLLREAEPFGNLPAIIIDVLAAGADDELAIL